MCRARWFPLYIIISLTLLGCESIKGSGITELQGQTVFNRVSFRTYEENKIMSSNRFSGGILILPGTECIIKAISPKKIKFIAAGERYVLTNWRMGYGVANTRASFYKFFAENKEAVCLGKVNPRYRESVPSGRAEVGMTKGEVLLCLGYPASLGKNNPTADDSRVAILASDNWYYLQSQGEKVLLKFEAGVLAQVSEK